MVACSACGNGRRSGPCYSPAGSRYSVGRSLLPNGEPVVVSDTDDLFRVGRGRRNESWSGNRPSRTGHTPTRVGRAE